MRRIGVLKSQATDDPSAHARNAAFLTGPPGTGLDGSPKRAA
jgi:hypothetical protein